MFFHGKKSPHPALQCLFELAGFVDPVEGELLEVGFDAFADIESWKDFRAIFGLCNLIVTSRPGFDHNLSSTSIPIAVRELFCYVEKEKAFRHASGRYLSFLRITDMAIAASEIRERVANKKSIRYLVPSQVEAYILSNGLYRRKGASR